jgi:hypothetical protein
MNPIARLILPLCVATAIVAQVSNAWSVNVTVVIRNGFFDVRKLEMPRALLWTGVPPTCALLGIVPDTYVVQESSIDFCLNNPIKFAIDSLEKQVNDIKGISDILGNALTTALQAIPNTGQVIDDIRQVREVQANKAIDFFKAIMKSLEAFSKASKESGQQAVVVALKAVKEMMEQANLLTVTSINTITEMSDVMNTFFQRQFAISTDVFSLAAITALQVTFATLTMPVRFILQTLAAFSTTANDLFINASKALQETLEDIIKALTNRGSSTGSSATVL